MTDNTQKKETLLDIAVDLQFINDKLTELEGDADNPEIASKLDAWFDVISDDLEAKVAGYIGLIREKELRAKALKEERDRLDKSLKAYANSGKALKERLQFAMEQVLHKDKIETSRGTAAIQKNGGKQKVDIQIPSHELPPKYQRMVIDPDAEAIYDALKAGEEIDGCSLQDRGTHLRIR